MKVLVDASAIIEWRAGNPNAIRAINESENINISSLSQYEVLVGDESEKVKDFFRNFPLLPFTARDSLKAVNIYRALAKKGKVINTMDILIAAQAFERGLTIVTKDGDFDRIKDVEVVKIE
ncbi:MAG: type II toxin-antitoxin system VapC family toxin [Candidatus Micrarchaeota archaeon]|nr:type II toxin-antitoxin system VapC family toxin [Candidatus Micrarchaeota archaeon]